MAQVVHIFAVRMREDRYNVKKTEGFSPRQLATTAAAHTSKTYCITNASAKAYYTEAYLIQCCMRFANSVITDLVKVGVISGYVVAESLMMYRQ